MSRRGFGGFAMCGAAAARANEARFSNSASSSRANDASSLALGLGFRTVVGSAAPPGARVS
jgi:hypothetical protein